MGKPSWYNQPPRSTKPFILLGSINTRDNHLCRVAGNTVCKWSHERTRGLLTYMRYTIDNDLVD